MNKLIAIDAGHGGSDPGACASAAQEKNITLEIAKKLKSELLNQGYKVFMTRENDTYDTPLKKAQKANEKGADIFISIHCNSASSTAANGIETLAYDLAGDSGKLAKMVQTQLIKATGLMDRGIKKRKDLIVLNSTKMTAILVETAFISNQSERLLLLSDSFQEKTAKAICRGVCEYLGMEYKEEKKMQKTAIKLTVNGTAKTMEGFNVDGTNYVTIRDLCNALGVKVMWDGNTKTVVLNKS